MASRMEQPSPLNDALFKRFYGEIRSLVVKRRSSWVLTTLPWEDVSSMLETHIWRKIHQYDQSRPFDHWCNVVLTNAIKNLLRDLLYKHAKPCISAGPAGGSCVYNKGDDQCSWKGNPSGIQCSKCPIFAEWQKKRESKHNISATLSLENHTDEVHAYIYDSLDIEASKYVIDERITAQLSKDDATVYKLLFVKHWSFTRVGKKMGYKIQGDNKVPGYQKLTKMVAKFKRMARQIIIDKDLA